MNDPGRGVGLARALLAMIGGQIALHSCMAGIRMASPLAALREGHAAWAVGVLLGLFATAPILLALPAGRLADRHGYHLPIRVAVGLTVSGGVAAIVATLLPAGQFMVLCVAAVLGGAGANVGLIAIQRSAGRMSTDPTELKQIFSWLGLAPALANVVGPVLAGTLIDLGGFRLAFAALAALPLLGLVWARLVPVEAGAAAGHAQQRQNSWNLLREPGFARLLLVNWLIASSWDIHSFLVPILGYERGFSASAIGLILGVFATAVAVVRLAIPVIAHRLREAQVLVGSMLVCAAVFAVYPLARSSWVMGCCAVVLGLALGAVQPMVMTTLHQITPPARHGEAIALRSMAINLSSAVMPLVFGVAGAALGPAALFWMMSAAVASGSVAARQVGAAKPAFR
ncbi:MAG TPA: MFS transporter [Caldimonas sp.]|jgi:MFS family permease|nr:MFS transporter [Caldimonas sp.]HEX4236282.1 MFS transporter [Caldimonas sp.]